MEVGNVAGNLNISENTIPFKKRENSRSAPALSFAVYNFCPIHSTIRRVPAMEAGIAFILV
jgi:hypothetical protein